MNPTEGAKLTKAQRKYLLSLTGEWVAQDAEWRATPTFHSLLDRDLAEWKDEPLPYTQGDVACGPGSHGAYRWWLRITPAGRTALAQEGGEDD